jgi:hypothetical protein
MPSFYVLIRQHSSWNQRRTWKMVSCLSHLIEKPIPTTLMPKDCKKSHRTLGMWRLTRWMHRCTSSMKVLKKGKRFSRLSKHPCRIRSDDSVLDCGSSITFGFSSTFAGDTQLNLYPTYDERRAAGLGYSSKATMFVFWTASLSRYGMRDLCPEQGVQQSLLLLKHIRANQQLST